VEVFNRRAWIGQSPEGVRGKSAARVSHYRNVRRPKREQARIVLHPKPLNPEFAHGWRLRKWLKKYSDHDFPCPSNCPSSSNGKTTREQQRKLEWETVQPCPGPLDPRGPYEVKDENIRSLQALAMIFENPLELEPQTRSRKLELHQPALTYLGRAPFDLYQRERRAG